MHDEARIGRSSLANDDLVPKVNERVRDDRRFTISDLSLHFSQISRTLLYDIDPLKIDIQLNSVQVFCCYLTENTIQPIYH